MTAIAPWDAVLVIIKAVMYAATLCACGGQWFRFYGHPFMTAADQSRILRHERIWLIVALLSTSVRLPVAAVSISGAMAGLWDWGLLRMLAQGAEGGAIGLRCLGVLLMLTERSTGRRPSLLALTGSIVAATSFAWVGHMHALAPPVSPIPILVLHLMCVAFWLGGLLPLRLIAGDRDLPRVAALVTRFGTAALPVVGVLAVAGIGLASLLLNDIEELWTTDYGRWLASKLISAGGLVSLAAFNRWRLTPRLRARDGRAATILQRSILAEIAIVLLILVMTAAMTTLDGPQH